MTEVKTVEPARHGLVGMVAVPGDKSISHRSVMFSGLGRTPVHIKNFLHAADCLSTVGVMRALGVHIEFISKQELLVTGNGLHELREPETVLDAGNSGTTLRLMMGLLAAQPFFSAFTGDASLSGRPMRRVLQPLMQMGGAYLWTQSKRKSPTRHCACGTEALWHRLRKPGRKRTGEVCYPACRALCRCTDNGERTIYLTGSYRADAFGIRCPR